MPAKTPAARFYFAVVAMVVNVVVAVGLSPVIGWIAPAHRDDTGRVGDVWPCWPMAHAASGWPAKFDARFHRRIWRIMAASAVMGGTLWIGNLALQPMIAEPWWRGYCPIDTDRPRRHQLFRHRAN